MQKYNTTTTNLNKTKGKKQGKWQKERRKKRKNITFSETLSHNSRLISTFLWHCET